MKEINIKSDTLMSFTEISSKETNTVTGFKINTEDADPEVQIVSEQKEPVIEGRVFTEVVSDSINM